MTPGAIEPENVSSTSQDGRSGTQDQVILDDLIVAGSGAGQIGTESNHNLKFMVNSSTEVMVLKTNGDEGIGNTNPGQLLVV